MKISLSKTTAITEPCLRLLHSMGHDMLAVSDALHAVALLDEANNGIDLVILDLNLPGWAAIRS